MKYIKNFEKKLVRQKDILVKCKQDLYSFIDDKNVEKNPQLIYDDKHVYKIFEKGEIYKMHGPFETIDDNIFIVYIDTKLKHSIGQPRFPKFIYKQFLWYCKTNNMDSERHFEDYFDIPEETNKYIEYWKIKKDIKKYNL